MWPRGYFWAIMAAMRTKGECNRNRAPHPNSGLPQTPLRRRLHPSRKNRALIDAADSFDPLSASDAGVIFREGPGTRVDAATLPSSFVHINDLRTDLRHDVDHGDKGKIRSKRKRAGTTFALYAGEGTPDTIEPARYPLFQANILTAIEGDLRVLLSKPTPNPVTATS